MILRIQPHPVTHQKHSLHIRRRKTRRCRRTHRNPRPPFRKQQIQSYLFRGDGDQENRGAMKGEHGDLPEITTEFDQTLTEDE
ncbi:hypothetical protein Hdeb2414_s0024g00649681 [Helianthus debilis subsp. tardiflorus]